jgi:hypothetical protein
MIRNGGMRLLMAGRQPSPEACRFASYTSSSARTMTLLDGTEP